MLVLQLSYAGLGSGPKIEISGYIPRVVGKPLYPPE